MAGGAIQGLGMGLFLFPHSIPSGGAGGITVLLNHWFNIGMGQALWIVNFTLLFVGIHYLGKRFAIWTVIAITMTSLSVVFFEQFSIPNRNLLYDLIFGSVFLGTGIGLLLRQGVSNGGIGVVALIISTRRKILPGRPLFLINIIIFMFTAVIVDWKLIFLALISQWISTVVVDLVCQVSFQQSYSLNWRKKP
ncbi:YitT family protein [Oceanobacillus piezotolerans]|uniref:YitT family protein n=2 Tax=Oceanobacillus piezotolerans TaxID=2448030 RepID=A0A498D5R4_9BACI|nr:YitT family protein [Oceanobacillus piezotolerans]